MIDFYTAATPNGHKISIALEEMVLPYRLHSIDLGAAEQKSDAFVRLSPNGRIPAIVDRDANNFAIFESGAILVYLAEKTGQFYPSEIKERSRVMQWLMFQMGGIGPMMGQANVFHRYFPERLPIVIERYQKEVTRLFGVLNRQLEQNEFLAGDYSIADIANFAWVRTFAWSGVAIAHLTNLQRWLEVIGARPAVRRGIDLPPPANAEQTRRSGQRILV